MRWPYAKCEEVRFEANNGHETARGFQLMSVNAGRCRLMTDLLEEVKEKEAGDDQQVVVGPDSGGFASA